MYPKTNEAAILGGGGDWVVGGGRNREQEGFRMWGRKGREIPLSPHYVNNQ